MSAQTEVHEASEKFYNALNHMAKGDSGLMSNIWSHGTAVSTMHPIGGREVGWDAIRASFEQVAQIATDGKIGLKDQQIQVAEDMAYEVGVEHGQLMLAGHAVTIEHRVTNIYQRIDGVWKMVHHHTDVSPAMLDVLSQL